MRQIFQKIRSFPLLAVLIVLLLQLYIFMYGCSSTAGTDIGTPGRSLYASKCASCHRLLPPQDYTAEQWRHYVDKYGEKLTPEQKQVILDYLRPRAADEQNDQQASSR